ncbi:Sterile alpha motif domain-containing protein 11 [Anthophora retusa]
MSIAMWTGLIGETKAYLLLVHCVENFREHRIDGAALPLLSEDHLTGPMGMKLGPALKLRALLARKLGACTVCLHCAHCHQTPLPALNAAAAAAAASQQQHQQQQQQQQQMPGRRPSSTGN